MSDKKKDLTRIEDLSEYIHELNSTEEEAFTEELPDIPVSDFTSNEESEESEGSDLFSNDFESTTEDFNSSFTTEDETTETPSWEETPSLDFTSNEETQDDSSFEVSNDTFLDEPETIEAEAEAEAEAEVEPGPIPSPLPSFEQEYKSPETFEDLKKFSENSSFTGMATEGNPSFSVLIKNVRFIEDINDIVSLLRELKLLSDSEEQTRGRLMRGMLLVPRISEYSAIYLGQKLRRFDIDIQIGLSDEIHPPKHQETPETGIATKYNLYQNQTHHFHFDDPKLEISQIIVAASPSLEGHQVLRYIGVASEHKILDSQIVEDENSDDIPIHYQELAQKLKAHALKAHANAVIGLSYQLTPIPSEYGLSGHKYRLSCTGNLVWVNKL